MEWTLSWFWFWVILAVILVVGEIFTIGFFLLPFGVGAAVTAAAAWFGLGVVGQWIVFLIVSIPALLLLKRFADRVTQGREMLNVASDRAVGQTGVIVKEVQPYGGGGEVRVGTEVWRAEPDPQERIPLDTLVEVLRVEGTRLIVRPKSSPPVEGGSS